MANPYENMNTAPTPENKNESKNTDIEVMEPGTKDVQSDLDKQIAAAAGTDKANIAEVSREIETMKEGDQALSPESQKLYQTALEKLDEMREKVLEKKKGFLNKMFISEKEVNIALGIIAVSKEKIQQGMAQGKDLELDLHTIKDKVKFASDVDLSGLPENPNKKKSIGNSPAYG